MNKINTIEDFNKNFPSNKEVVNFLWEIRQDVWSRCPKCNHTVHYLIENGKRRKCANNKCYFRFTVISQSLIDGTNVPLKEWLFHILLFCLKNGRYSTTSHAPAYHFSTAFMMDEKIKILLSGIPKIGVPKDFLFIEAVKNIYRLRHKRIELRKRTHYFGKSSFEDNEDLNLSDEGTYKKCVLFANRNMYYSFRQKWIFCIFASAEEIVNETYIAIAETGEKNITSDFIVMMIRKTQNRMWDKYIKDHPKLYKWIRKYAKEWKAEQRNTLSDYYLKCLTKNEKREVGDWKEEVCFETAKKILQQKREKITELRKSNNYADNSEFKNIGEKIFVYENKKDVYDTDL